MKKLAVVLVAVVMVVLSASANKLPAIAAKLPTDLKQEIVQHIDYPIFAKQNFIEGDVWMKVTVDESSNVKIIDLSATNQELGKHVLTELKNLKLENSKIKAGDVYIMKVKFDLSNF